MCGFNGWCLPSSVNGGLVASTWTDEGCSNSRVEVLETRTISRIEVLEAKYKMLKLVVIGSFVLYLILFFCSKPWTSSCFSFFVVIAKLTFAMGHKFSSKVFYCVSIYAHRGFVGKSTLFHPLQFVHRGPLLALQVPYMVVSFCFQILFYLLYVSCFL